MTAGATCHCGHSIFNHRSLTGWCDSFGDNLDDPFAPGAKWTRCPCPHFDDSVPPKPGERLTFGVHRQPSPAAETAPAWPSLPAWHSRVRARTTRALRGIR